MVRHKKRYLLTEVSFEDGMVDESLAHYVFYESMKNAVKEVYGIYGLACITMSLRVKYLNPLTNIVFVSCSRDYYKILQCSLPFIKEINKRKCIVKTLHIGGTIRSCQRFLVQHNKIQLMQMLDHCKTPAEREKVSSVINSATNEATALDPVSISKRRTKSVYQVTSRNLEMDEITYDSDNS